MYYYNYILLKYIIYLANLLLRTYDLIIIIIYYYIYLLRVVMHGLEDSPF